MCSEVDAGMRAGQSQVGPGWGGRVSSGSLRCPQVPSLWDAGVPHKAPVLPALGQLRMFPLCPPLGLHLTSPYQRSGSRRKVVGDGVAESQGRREGPRGPCSPSRDSNTQSPQTVSQSITQGTRVHDYRRGRPCSGGEESRNPTNTGGSEKQRGVAAKGRTEPPYL